MFEGFEAVEWNRHERRRVVIGGIVLAHDVAMKTLIFTGRGGLRTDGAFRPPSVLQTASKLQSSRSKLRGRQSCEARFRYCNICEARSIAFDILLRARVQDLASCIQYAVISGAACAVLP